MPPFHLHNLLLVRNCWTFNFSYSYSVTVTVQLHTFHFAAAPLAAGIHVELSRLLLDKWRWFVGVWSRRYVGARKLDALMKDWAGVEEEEEAMAAAEAAALAAAAAGSGAGDDDKEPRVLQVSRM